MTISMVLADDHPLVRRGIRSVFEAEPDFAVVGEADDGLQTLRLAERLQPDVLVLDLMMPGLNGLDALPALACGRTGGLAGMQERARLAGGRLTIDAAPERGTLLTAQLPLSGPWGAQGDDHLDRPGG